MKIINYFLFLLGFGISFILGGCQNPSISSNSLSSNYQKKIIQDEIANMQKNLTYTQGGRSGVYFSIAEKYIELAQLHFPKQRDSLYVFALENVDQAITLFPYNDPMGREQFLSKNDSLIDEAFQYEIQKGKEHFELIDDSTHAEISRDHFELAHILRPMNIEILLYLYPLHYALKEYKQAIITLNNIEKEQFLTTKQQEQLAFLYVLTNQYKQAQSRYNQLIDNKSSLSVIHGFLNQLLKHGEYKFLLEIVPSIINKSPNNPLYHQFYVDVLFSACQFYLANLVMPNNNDTESDVLIWLDRLINEAPNHIESLFSFSSNSIKVRDRVATQFLNLAISIYNYNIEQKKQTFVFEPPFQSIISDSKRILSALKEDQPGDIRYQERLNTIDKLIDK